MKKTSYAYDTLFYETYASDVWCYSIRIKKYRFKSARPLVSVSVSRVPLLSDFSSMPDNYDSLCQTIEARINPNLSLPDMIALGRQMLRDKFLQQCFDLDFI